jgi:hypothetical protein
MAPPRVPPTLNGHRVVSLREVLEGVGKALSVSTGEICARFKFGRLTELQVQQEPAIADLERATLVWRGPIEPSPEGGRQS